jgi:hypothetical protein
MTPKILAHIIPKISEEVSAANNTENTECRK